MDWTGVVIDRPAAGDDLEPEADVDPVLLEKAAATRCAGQPPPGEFREERASANEDLAAPWLEGDTPTSVEGRAGLGRGPRHLGQGHARFG
jgi:hypothetical protein